MVNRWRLPNVIPWWWKTVALLIVLILAYMVFQGWLEARDDRIARESIAAQQQRTAVAAETIATDAGQVQAETQRVEVVVTQQRDESRRRYEEVRDTNAYVAAYVGTALPPELLAIARERRIARERSDGTAARSERTDGTEDSAR